MTKMSITVIVEDYAGYDANMYAEHGLAVLITKHDHRGPCFRVLLDCGTSGELLLHNMDLLGVAPGDIDVLALSHCHYDHTGGILPLLDARDGKPLSIIAHPSIQRLTWTDDPQWRLIGMPAGTFETSCREYQASWLLSTEAIYLGHGITWMGQIPRETPTPPAPDLLTIIDGKPGADPMLDDTGLVLDLGEEIVIVAGCSHAGARNIARQGSQLCNGKKIAAYIGGLHLIGAARGKAAQLGQALTADGVAAIYAGHCTGFQAEAEIALQTDIPFHKLHCGKEITFACQE